MDFGFHTTGNEIARAFADQVRGKTFLVTGTSPGGLGAETVYSLAQSAPKHLILAGRSAKKIQTVIDRLKTEHPSVLFSFLELDLSSLVAVREAAAAVKKLDVKLDVLINNAAVMANPFSLTVDGIESQFATNQVGHFLFTNLLLRDEIIAEGGRIVIVSSSGSVRQPSMILPHFDDLTYDDGRYYNPWIAYGVSKSANMLFARSLAEKCKGFNISTFSLNPGSIRSELQRNVTMELVEDAIRIAKESEPEWQFPSPKTLQEGCSTQLRAALDPDLVAYSGSYLDNCQPVEFPEHVGVYGAADKVWAISERLVNQSFFS